MRNCASTWPNSTQWSECFLPKQSHIIHSQTAQNHVLRITSNVVYKLQSASIYIRTLLSSKPPQILLRCFSTFWLTFYTEVKLLMKRRQKMAETKFNLLSCCLCFSTCFNILTQQLLENATTTTRQFSPRIFSDDICKVSGKNPL